MAKRPSRADRRGGYGVLKKLILEGEFDDPIPSATVVHRIKEKIGKRWRTSHVQTYMAKFMRAGIVQAVKPAGSTVNYWVLTHVSRDEALRQINKGKRVREVEEEEELFSENLVAKLNKDFSNELDELRDNFGKNGLSTAFLLRKILEKLIIIVLGKNGRQHLLRDKHHADRWLGLTEIVDVAVQENPTNPLAFVPTELKGLFLHQAKWGNCRANCANCW